MLQIVGAVTWVSARQYPKGDRCLKSEQRNLEVKKNSNRLKMIGLMNLTYHEQRKLSNHFPHDLNNILPIVTSPT
ncbi:hypothetical protein CapIbe_000509 [Capra ibex]